MKWCFIFIMSVFLVFGQPSYSNGEKSTDKNFEAVFSQELDSFFKALEDKDWDTFNSFFPTKDQHDFLAILSSEETLPASIKSKEELEALYRPVMFKDNRTKFIAHIKNIVVNGDLAYAESDNDVFVDGENIKEDISYRVNIVFVFKKIDDRWYFIFDYNRPLNKSV